METPKLESLCIRRKAMMTSLILFKYLVVGSMLMAVSVCLGASSLPYEYRRGSPDGIGKYYFDREIAHVMGYEGAAWLERPARVQEERPDLLLKALHLMPGMTVADIGAGSGYLAKRMAPLVLPGKVLAVDVQPQMIALLRDLSRQGDAKNVMPIQATASDPNLPSDSIDLAIMVDVYHELEYPQEIISRVYASLKAGGELVLVEYRSEDPAVPIKALHKMTVEQVRREMRQFSLTFVRSDERLPTQHIIVFRKH